MLKIKFLQTLAIVMADIDVFGQLSSFLYKVLALLEQIYLNQS